MKRGPGVIFVTQVERISDGAILARRKCVDACVARLNEDEARRQIRVEGFDDVWTVRTVIDKRRAGQR